MTGQGDNNWHIIQVVLRNKNCQGGILTDIYIHALLIGLFRPVLESTQLE